MKNSLLCLTLLLLCSSRLLWAHCQVPCGIYDDANVVGTLYTDCTTIKKASQQIQELAKDPAKNAQQLTRWVMNKEAHAESVQKIISQYFLAQRLKYDESQSEAYLKKLTLCHQIIVTAMKCKQSTDLAHVESLHKLLHELDALFVPKKDS